MQSRLVAGTCMALFAVLFVFCAWTCDDAWITFRVVDNFVTGHGLRWNTDERVQAFTSPLYTLLTALFWWPLRPSGDMPSPTAMYLLAIGLSAALSLSTVWTILRTRALPAALLALGLLLSAQSFMLFTSSGLETPLLFLLLVLFVPAVRRSGPKALRRAALLAALLFLTRFDSALLTAPALLLRLASDRPSPRAALRSLLPALVVVLAWLGFALVYFGSPLPNTYFAKVGYQVDAGILWEMGWAWLALGALQDPITLLTIGVGLGCGLWRGGVDRALAIGALLGALFYVRVGGDFIGHRFLAPSLVICAVLLADTLGPLLTRSRAIAAAVALSLVVYSAVIPGSPARLVVDEPSSDDIWFYWPATRLLSWSADKDFPVAPFHRVRSAQMCHRMWASERRVTIAGGGIGGFCRGPRHHFIAPAGITDALMARLPITLDQPFYPGHVAKPLPRGYVRSVQQQANHIVDPPLSAYYDHLRTVISGPLFTSQRWANIWSLNTSDKRYPDAYTQEVPPYPHEFHHRHISLPERLDDWLANGESLRR